MRKTAALTALAAGCALLPLASAQDSVAPEPLASDQLSSFTPPYRVAYIVDLAPIVSSADRDYGIAPVLKTTRPGAASAVLRSVAISPDSLTITGPASSSYLSWASAGPGINPLVNTGATTSVLLPSNASVSRGALALAEFGTTGLPAYYTGIVIGVIDVDPLRPERLHVTRIHAASSVAGNASAETGSISLGGVSADASVYLRADNLAGRAPGGSGTLAFGSTDRALDENLFIVDALARDPQSLGVLAADATAGTGPGYRVRDAARWVLKNQAVTVSAPVGLSGRLYTPDFAGEVGTASTEAGGTSFSPSHLASGSTAHRGAASIAPRGFFGSATATLAIAATSAGLERDRINLWGVSSTGAVTGNRSLELPALLTDPLVAGGGPRQIAIGTLEHHRGPAAFQGSNATVAVAVSTTQAPGPLYAATTASDRPGGAGAQVVVARLATASAAPEWALAAWVEAGDGKPVVDASGLRIGRLASADELVPPVDGLSAGPPISSPGLDNAGNVYFIAPVRLDSGGIQRSLVRAVRDPASLAYTLERLIGEGDTTVGTGSGVAWRLERLDLATGITSFNGSTIQSTPSPRSLWAGAVRTGPAADAPPASTPASDPRWLDAIALSATIAYDTDADGVFDDAPGSQRYEAALYLGRMRPGGPACSAADVALPLGSIDIFDIIEYFARFSAGRWQADLNASGTVDIFDIVAFFAAFSEGCPA